MLALFHYLSGPASFVLFPPEQVLWAHLPEQPERDSGSAECEPPCSPWIARHFEPMDPRSVVKPCPPHSGQPRWSPKSDQGHEAAAARW